MDVRAGMLLDVVEGRDAAPAAAWLAARDPAWRDQIVYATLDLSGAYRAVFDTMLPDAIQVADPFHVGRIAGDKLQLVRRHTRSARVDEAMAPLQTHHRHAHRPLQE